MEVQPQLNLCEPDLGKTSFNETIHYVSALVWFLVGGLLALAMRDSTYFWNALARTTEWRRVQCVDAGRGSPSRTQSAKAITVPGTNRRCSRAAGARGSRRPGSRKRRPRKPRQRQDFHAHLPGAFLGERHHSTSTQYSGETPRPEETTRISQQRKLLRF